MSDAGKRAAAYAALEYIRDNMIVGVGTGSTVKYFIEALTTIKQRIDGVVASSNATAALLKAAGFNLQDLNAVGTVPIYVDGADEVNSVRQMIKGGGGALVREKIIATAAQKFICIADRSKKVDLLGEFPVAVEIIPMARSLVARQIVKMGGDPVYREGFITDNGNVIVDVYNLKLLDPLRIEEQFKALVGVVDSGIFAKRPADIVLLGSENGVEKV